MTHNIDYSSTSSEAIIKALCHRLEEIRLSRNVSQAGLAEEAGVSRTTMTRIAIGKPISLDSFVRVMLALGLTDHLAALLPDPGVRPVDRLRFGGKERRRARPRLDSNGVASRTKWIWGDEKKTS